MATFSTSIDKEITTSTYPTEDLKKPDNAQLALDEIQTEKFYNTLKSYYSYREDDNSFNDMSSADLLEYFYNDRSWRNHNTVAMGMDMANVFGEDDPDRIAEFSYIQQTYQALPSWWDDPNRSFGSWLIDNGGAMLADPVNLVSLRIGGVVAGQAFKQALRVALKNRMAKEISEITIKEAAKEAEKMALGQAIKKGALTEGYINAGITTGQDIMLQNTAIKAGIQDEFSLKQTGISTAAGFGFGTIFGAGFSAGSFKLTTRNLKNNAIKNLNDIHKFGKSTTNNAKLFDELTINHKSKAADKNAPKIKKEPKSTKEYINDLRKSRIKPDDKPPNKIINITKLKKPSTGKDKSYESFIKFRISEITENVKTDLENGRITKEQMIEEAVALGMDRKKFTKMADDMANSQQFVEGYATVVAQANEIKSLFDEIGALATELNRVDLSPKEQTTILNRIEYLEDILNANVIRKQKGSGNVAKIFVAHQIDADGTKAAKLLVDPEDTTKAKQKIGSFEEKVKYWQEVGKLGDREQIIAAHQKLKDYDRWDLAAEFVNNNLLSSPDTHILNIISGLTQTFWKPSVLLLRGANMLPTDAVRARRIMREALETFVYQFAYTGFALKRAGKTLWEGRAILDSKFMKHDNNIRQGQLQRWISGMGKLATEPLGTLGKVVQNTVVEPTARIVTLPMRILSAGDEFLKSMFFQARMASIINSKIIDESPDFNLLKGDGFRKRYKDRAKELQAEFINNDTGRAIEIGNTVQDRLNAPLHFSRESSYTNPASEVNPLTGKEYGGITGRILQITGKNKWTRAFGLHFINTPSNLLRWNFQHLPFLGRYQFQMRNALAEADLPPVGKDAGVFEKITRAFNSSRITAPIRGTAKFLTRGKIGNTRYLNPEAAAEANARIQMGWLLWTSAFNMVGAGKITGGGSRDWRENRERTRNTGWQPYSWRTDDGRYISLNRLDPLFTPMFIAADIMEGLNTFLKDTDDLPPSVEKQYTEAAMAGVALLTRNITSKFYTKNIIEMFNFMTSDDYMKSKSPERAAGAFFAQLAFKAVPMSGGLRYLNRVNDEWERDVWSFMDRIRTLNPTGVNDRIMPQRNMFGQKINRKTGWLFGLGGESGLWSTPFAMTKWQNNETAKFLDKITKWKYQPPAKTDRGTGFNLKNMRNSDNQTAYDRMLELKMEVVFNERGMIVNPKTYKGKRYNLQQIVEKLIANKQSKLYINPTGEVAGKDYQADVIIDLIHEAEKAAYFMMLKEFPEIEERILLQDEYTKEKFKESKEDWINTLTQ